MPYQITSSDQHKIVLERPGDTFSRVFFILIGTLFCLIGVGFILLSPGFEFPFVMIKILFPLFGLGAIAAGIAGQQKKSGPELITFDHAKGAVIIETVKGGNQKGYIRYDEIEKFDTYVEKRSSSSSSRNTTNYYYYHILLRKKDGGEWFLTRSGNQIDADAILKQLSTAVQTDKPASFLPAPTLTEKISKEEKMDKTFVYWQNKVGFVAPIFIVVFAAVFLGILGSMFTSIGDLGIFGYGVMGFILFVFCIVIFFSLKTMIKNATTRYAVAVGKAVLEYIEISKATGVAKIVKSIPLKEVYSVVYSFSPAKTYSAGGLSILTQQEHQQVQYERSHPIEALKNMLTGKNKTITISIIALNPVECLQLESWLQELVKKKGGGGVL